MPRLKDLIGHRLALFGEKLLRLWGEIRYIVFWETSMLLSVLASATFITPSRSRNKKPVEC
jgi:hypothetical protein